MSLKVRFCMPKAPQARTERVWRSRLPGAKAPGRQRVTLLPVALVVNDEDGHRQLVARERIEFRHAHHQATVTENRSHPLPRTRDRGANRDAEALADGPEPVSKRVVARALLR